MYFLDVMMIENKINWGDFCGILINLILNQLLIFYGLDNVGILKCIICFRIENGYLLCLNIKYVFDILGCVKLYFYIGNDVFRIDVDFFMLYKFCDVIWDLEIVLWGYYLWIVYNNFGNVKYS